MVLALSETEDAHDWKRLHHYGMQVRGRMVLALSETEDAHHWKRLLHRLRSRTVNKD
jgi:hypothetical protein